MSLVTASLLRQGSHIALAQAGSQLRDALLLYRANRYASAATLAVFCREEIGRSSILAEFAESADLGGSVTREQVNRACAKHVAKLWRALASVAVPLMGAEGLRVSAALHDRAHANYMRIRSEIEKREREIEQYMPGLHHTTRMRALYVDLSADGTWTRPQQLSREEAFGILDQAASDYAIRRDRVFYSERELTADEQSWLEGNELPLGEFPDP